ncbi:MAG: methyltransferase domain-containing protein [Clostridia bacterium]|nr:methyltransferase domain-containing protein [Clostridia bacterium]
MKTIDKDVLAGYNAGIEKGRLHKGLGLIEFERTKEILLETLPPTPAVIYDIGGGYGEYSCWLASLGYEVYLYDIAEKHIEMARELEKETGCVLKTASVADARSIPRPDGMADAVILFGPLYHITEYVERAECLKECKRLLKKDGILYTANITAFATTLKYVARYDLEPKLDDDDFYNSLVSTVETGIHTKKPMGLAYFHKPDEIRSELTLAGFTDIDLRGVIGPCWMLRNLEEAWKNEIKRESIMRVVRLLEKEESLMGLSTHFITISKKRNAR